MARGDGGAAGVKRRFRPVRLAEHLLVLALGVGALVGGVYVLYPFPYRAQVTVAAAANRLDPRLVLAVARAESRFRPDIVSRRGAIGLMQLTPDTAAWIAAKRRQPGPVTTADLDEPGENVSFGAWYLAWLLQDFGGRLPVALAAYNAGPSTVAAWLASGQWRGTRADVVDIPFPETREFVRRVLANYGMYRILYPHAVRPT